MAVYNSSFMDTATNQVDIFVGIGVAIGHPYLIGHLILFVYFLLFMILAFKHDFLEVVIFDSFTTTILAILFYVGGFIPATTIAFPAIFLFISIIFMFSTR